MNSFEGARADIVWDANTGQAVRDIGAVGDAYLKTTGAMTDEALRAALAQEKLVKAIKVSGPESIAAQRATLSYRSEMRSLATASNEAAAAQQRQTVATREQATVLKESRFIRGAAVGSGLGRSGLLFGSTAFIGGLAAAAGLKAVLGAASAEEVALTKLRVSLEDTGHSWATYSGQVEDALAGQVRATAFNREDLATALAANVRRFGDVGVALRANAVDADVARAKGISLADAQTLIQRSSTGNARSLLTLGVTYTKTAANADALKASTKYATAEQVAAAKAADSQANELSVLDAVNAKYHGNAQRFLETSAGKQALFNAELKQSEEIIGTALLPTFNRLLSGLSTYLDRMNRTGRLQHDVNTVVHDGGVAFHLVSGILHGLNKVTGDTTHSLILLSLAFVAIKNRAKIAALTAVGSEVAGIGTSAVIAEGEVAGLAGGLAGLAAIGPIAIPIILLTSTKVGNRAASSNVNSAESLFHDFFPKGGGLHPLAGFNDKTATDLSHLLFGTPLHSSQTSDAANANLSLPLQSPFPAFRPPTFPAYGYKGAGRGRTGPLILGLTNAQQTALYRAEGTPGSADDRAALQAQLATYNRLLAQPGLNPSQLNALLQGRNSVTDQLASIAASGASAAASAKRKAEEARRKAAAEAAKKRKALLSGLEQAPLDLRIELQTALAHGASEQKLLGILRDERKAIEHQVGELRKIGAGKEAILRARTNEAAVTKKIDAILKQKKGGAAENEKQFLESFQQIVGAYAPNAFPSGRGDTHLYELVHETRQTNAHLATITGRNVFPASGQQLAATDALAP